jgi:hypothetical protein
MNKLAIAIVVICLILLSLYLANESSGGKYFKMPAQLNIAKPVVKTEGMVSESPIKKIANAQNCYPNENLSVESLLPQNDANNSWGKANVKVGTAHDYIAALSAASLVKTDNNGYRRLAGNPLRRDPEVGGHHLPIYQNDILIDRNPVVQQDILG